MHKRRAKKMSESNNNVPIRITQLQEATEYEEGMYLAVAKAGRGTFKIPADAMTPSDKELDDRIDEIEPYIDNGIVYGEVQDAEIATFDDGSDLPMPKLEVSIEAYQEGSGDPSPENIRPINGWDEVNVSVSGVNLLDYDKWKNSSVTRGTAIWEDNGVTITATSNDAYVSPTNSKTFVKEGQTIILKWEESTNKEGTIYLFPNGSTEGMAISYNQAVKNLTYTVPSGVTFITFRFGVSNSGETISYKNIRIEFGNQSPTFVPYNGHTYTITFPSEAGTVYGGTLDVINGVLTVTHSEIDLGTLDWARNTDYANPFFSVALSGKKFSSEDLVCSIYVYGKLITGTTALNTMSNMTINAGNNSNALYIRDDSYIDATTFKTYLQNNNVQLVYELATPLTIQLNPTVVKSLRGLNKVFANTGNISDGKYIRNLNIIINELISRVSALEG
jgi:hypothetical protein